MSDFSTLFDEIIDIDLVDNLTDDNGKYVDEVYTSFVIFRFLFIIFVFRS